MLADEIMQVREHSDLLVSARDVQDALDVLAHAIADVCAGSVPVALCVMNGGLFTTSELARRWEYPLQMDYLQVTRYGGGTRGGVRRGLDRLSPRLENCDVGSDLRVIVPIRLWWAGRKRPRTRKGFVDVP